MLEGLFKIGGGPSAKWYLISSMNLWLTPLPHSLSPPPLPFPSFFFLCLHIHCHHLCNVFFKNINFVIKLGSNSYLKIYGRVDCISSIWFLYKLNTLTILSSCDGFWDRLQSPSLTICKDLASINEKWSQCFLGTFFWMGWVVGWDSIRSWNREKLRVWLLVVRRKDEEAFLFLFLFYLCKKKSCEREKVRDVKAPVTFCRRWKSIL